MSLAGLPSEIIQHLLYYVSPVDNILNFQLLSRHLRQLANEPLLWRYHCQNSFRFWNVHHDFRRKLKSNVHDVNWRELFLYRHRGNVRMAHFFEAILTTQVGRVRNFEQICKAGYDAKDFLLEQYNTPDSADDVLARRYFSGAMLNSVNRSVSIREWHALKTARDQVGPNAIRGLLEKALAAFDMFLPHDFTSGLEDISAVLDDMLAEFKAEATDFESLTTRQKALRLLRWLRAMNYVGLSDPERSYRSLQNCFLGHALRQEDHDSIPIISSAIFCCLAERLNLVAQCSAFPGHVHAVVFAPLGETLDGMKVDTAMQIDRMFLDPYGRDEEVPLAFLQGLLDHFGWQLSADRALAPASPVVIAMRTANNIKATADRMIELQLQADQSEAVADLFRRLPGSHALNMDSAEYAAQWAKLLLTRVDTFEWERDLAVFVRRFDRYLHEDAWLVEQYLQDPFESFMPLRASLGRHYEPEVAVPWELLRRIRYQDRVQPSPSRRSEAQKDVPYRIGQVFRHTSHRWIGVITGWTDESERYGRSSMNVRDAPSNEVYFTCLKENHLDAPMVAASNLEILHDESLVREDMFPLAGRYFKRFDPETCTFVSNVKEQFPED